jgi:hypothetical protein
MIYHVENSNVWDGFIVQCQKRCDSTRSSRFSRPDWDEFAPLLELIDDHRDELPEGYFE